MSPPCNVNKNSFSLCQHIYWIYTICCIYVISAYVCLSVYLSRKERTVCGTTTVKWSEVRWSNWRLYWLNMMSKYQVIIRHNTHALSLSLFLYFNQTLTVAETAAETAWGRERESGLSFSIGVCLGVCCLSGGKIEWGFVTRCYVTCDGLIYKLKKTKRSSFFVHSTQSPSHPRHCVCRENRATIICQVTLIFCKNEKKTCSSG